MQAMKELHLAEIGLISGGITKKQVITGIAIGVGALAVGAVCLTIGRNSQVASQVVGQLVSQLSDQDSKIQELLEQIDEQHRIQQAQLSIGADLIRQLKGVSDMILE